MKANQKLDLGDLENDVINPKYDIIKVKTWTTSNNDTGSWRLRLI